ncbi:ankyrin [Lepidopterella palustris CBS 459.81]|uniref:Ankyrin n=1 Tax=Lepidopterella palustris CBS 459.81 TaxID=1314670 RepID=A0A8E2DZW9_9PEZI|nr:ankyrin [Lepidopterella palustris CBS 459.81]
MSDALLKVACECLDPKPANRPTAIDLLSVCLKAETSQTAIRRSETFWKSLAQHSQSDQSSVVANATRHFVSGYLSTLKTKYSDREICYLMALQYLHYRPRITYSADHLTENIFESTGKSTVFHVAATATSKSKSLRKLTWEDTGWPKDPSLASTALKENEDGLLPSMVAAFQNNLIVAKQLLDIEEQLERLKVQRIVENGRMAFASHARKQIEFFYLILTNNGKQPPNLGEKFKADALGVAAFKGYDVVLKKLLELGTKITATSGERQETALHLAAAGGQPAIVHFLLDQGIHPNVMDNGRRMPLYCAAWSGHAMTVQILLDHGAPINARDDANRTALFGAASAGHEAVVSLLLTYGADRSLAGGSPVSETPLERAQKGGYEGVVQLLSSNRNPRVLINSRLHLEGK